MKNLVLSAILGLSLASATKIPQTVIGLGTGTIDNSHKNIIFKFEHHIYSLFNIGGRFAENYLNTYVNTIPIFVNDKILLNEAVGLEKYKIENKNETQAFLKYRTVLINKNIYPKAFLQIGTKSTTLGLGFFKNINNKLGAEFEVGKRWLYKKVENKKNTTSATLYINYSF